MTKLKTSAVTKVEPTNAELAELQAVISQGGTELTPIQTKLAWVYAEKRGLDIISRQLIIAIIRGKMTFITAIDGFRVIAERSGDYAGQDPIKYATDDKTGALLWAEATVYRHSWKDRGLTVRAYWAEFVPDGKGDYMWKRMPHVMLGKVAEAQALRKAFPNDMSGMYSDDEMAQAQPAHEVKPAKEQLEEQLTTSKGLAEAHGEAEARAQARREAKPLEPMKDGDTLTVASDVTMHPDGSITEEQRQAILEHNATVVDDEELQHRRPKPVEEPQVEPSGFEGKVMKVPDGVRQVKTPGWAMDLIKGDYTNKLEVAIKVGRSKHTVVLLGPITYAVMDLDLKEDELVRVDGTLTEIEWAEGKPKKKEIHLATMFEVGRDAGWVSALEEGPPEPTDLTAEAKAEFADLADAAEPEPTWKALPLAVGELDASVAMQAWFISATESATPKGKQMCDAWVITEDAKQRVHVVMSHPWAQEQGVYKLVEGEACRVTGIWQQVAGEDVVLATNIAEVS